MFKSKRSFLIGLVLVVASTALISNGFIWYGENQERNRINALGFSDTQEWDSEVYAQKTDFTPLVGSAIFSITIPPPPPNTSDETKEELEYMHRLVEERTPEKIREIRSEIITSNIVFGASTYGEIAESKPNTGELFDRALSEFNAIVVSQKEHFDRIRANKLDETLSIAIILPGHPAYPSGHASQSKLIALLLSELDPARADEYHESAVRIAHNREIAGVHYPSDSLAGQILAEKYFELLQGNEEFNKLLKDAREEW